VKLRTLHSSVCLITCYKGLFFVTFSGSSYTYYFFYITEIAAFLPFLHISFSYCQMIIKHTRFHCITIGTIFATIFYLSHSLRNPLSIKVGGKQGRIIN
jgi:hypothetical protein